MSTRKFRSSFIVSLFALGLFAGSAIAQEDVFARFRVVPPELSRLIDGKGLATSQSLAETLKQRKDAGGDARAHVLVSLDAPLEADVRDALADAGVEIIDKFDGNIWIARTDEKGLEAARRLKEVQGIDLIPPAAKISPQISLQSPFAWQKRGGDKLGYTVLFHKGVAAAEARRALQALSPDIKAEIPDQGFEYQRQVTVELSPDDIAKAARLDIIQLIEPQLPPDIDFNLLNTQPVSNVDDVQAAPYNLNGAGITVGIWEAGDVIRATHVDLTPRVTVEAGQTASEDGHALHVAGTVGSSGTNFPNTEGMAPAVTIRSWDATNDAAEMAAAAAAGLANRPMASNHSYGETIGWDNTGVNFTNNQNLFGQYTARSVSMDTVVAGDGVGVAATELVILKAAGNDRGDGPGNSPNPNDCRQGGLAIDADCVGPFSSSKNVITVGAMNGGTLIAGFSGFGPTDDGRLKPDVMANGTNVLSLGNQTGAQTNNGTWTAQGTSMATPAVTGIVALMAQQFANLGVAFPSAAAIKAILIQTARDVAGTGQSRVGPDFATGWGIVDAQAAMDLLRRPGGPGFAEGTLATTGAGGAWEFPFVVPAGQAELHVTLAWSDLPGTPTGAGPELVNDLDLRLLPPGGGAAQQPWTLNPANPGQAAVRNGGDDTLNNVEQVSVLNPAGGTWIARVTAKTGSLALGPQRFAIAGPITPDSASPGTPKANIMMVLDKSGSMILPSATGGLNKMQALQNAGRAFIDYMDVIGGHNVGLVAFDSGVASTSPGFSLQALDNGSAPNARNAIGNLSPGGMTAIIAGIAEAANQLASPAASNPNDVVILFSDGRHNTPSGSDVASIDTVMAPDSRFFSVGFGTDVDSSVMPNVAANHDGIHLEEQGLQAGQLAKLFMVVGGLATDETIVVDPDYPLAPGAAAAQLVRATEHDSSLTFATFWNEPELGKIGFQLNGPDRRCKVPIDTGVEGLQLRSGKGYSIIRIDLPYKCKSNPDSKPMHAGTWRLRLRNQGNSADVAKVVVLSNSGTKLHFKGQALGGKALLTAQLVENGKLQRIGVRMLATIRPNKPGTGESGKQDQITDVPGRPPFIRGADGALEVKIPRADAAISTPKDAMPPPLNSAEFESLNLRARELRLSEESLLQLAGQFKPLVQPTGIELLDDGTQGDAVASDGIFSALVTLPAAGLYQANLVAVQSTLTGTVRREALASFFDK
jgi:Subtilase family/von Willebrand factor type A domain